ncbi:PKD domain-containing protein [Flammeovirga kamogawensis]|uniref:Sulfatase-like hydrolase/transferase n=1 Tax=Flammeovirga kamogawensis TaxID=373891 RepID=A0ABX8H3C1_9BACT|nr:PKD domain-containing protein [Flammeovirga kamogawensis]MBB6461992.1 PKD repeat protein/arylsulfatase A-like enzyme [Flammeovirga kamogawensis]QWG10404.1 sulfatase-like hydrolase/transferase [Flammeovirga kamogawensis]TRX63914.1 sulfatase-like hydrolase/transferase [Flammeovirga kamogawensis]
MKRIKLFLGLIALLLSIEVYAQNKPNVLIIHTDEHNFKTISKYRDLNMSSGNISAEEYYNPWNASVHMETPNIDRIATEGAISTKHYATSPTCTPSRASLMTSLYPGSTGAARNDRPMTDDLPTFANVFKENGYSTSYIGKWHLEGYDNPSQKVWGAGRNFGFDNIEWRIEKEHWTWYNEDGEPPYNWGEEGQPDPVDGKPWIFATDFYTNKALEIMEADVENNKPFCLVVSIPDPHTPNHSSPKYADWARSISFNAPKTYVETYRTADEEAAGVVKRPTWADKRNNNDVWYGSTRYAEFDEFYMQEYWGMLRSVDENVGRMLDFLDEKGIADNTIVIYTVDHGDMTFEHSRINKGVPYENSAKIPFIIRYPEKIKEGKIVTTPNMNVDVAPTILSLAGLPAMENVHGEDISSLYTNDDLLVNVADTVYITEDAGWWASAATERYKLVLANKDQPYLIDLQEDPLELKNQLEDVNAPNYADYYAKALKLEDFLKREMLAKNELYGAGTKFLIWMTSGPEIPAPPAVAESVLPLNTTLFGFEGNAVVDGTAKKWSMGASGDFTITDEKVATGTKSLKFHHTTPLTGNGGAAHAPAGMVQLATGKFTFKAKVFVEAGSAASRFRLFVKNPSSNLDPFNLPTTTGEWVDVSYDFTMNPGTSPEGTFSIVIQPGDAAANGGTSSTVYFDDIEIVENIPLPFTGLDPVLFGFEGSQYLDGEEKNWFLGTSGAAYSRDEFNSGQRSLDLSDVSNIASNVSLAAHSPIKSLYLPEGEYELSVRVKAKENNKIKNFDIMLKDNKPQSLYIINSFDISTITEADGWVTLTKNISFGKDSDPTNGQVTVRVREADLNLTGEGYLFVDDIQIKKKETAEGSTNPADETPKDVVNGPDDINYMNSHLFGFEGPTLIDLGSGKVRVRWTGDSEFGIVNLNGAPHGERVMRFAYGTALDKTKSVYVDKGSAVLPRDRDLEFTMKVFIEEGSTINKIRVADLTSPVMQFDLTAVEQGKWTTLKTTIAQGKLNDFNRIKLQVQVPDAGTNGVIYLDEIRVTDVPEGEGNEGCVANSNTLLNSCYFGFEEDASTALWTVNTDFYAFTSEKYWGGANAVKVFVEEEITSGSKNLTPKGAGLPNVVVTENVIVSMKVWIDEAVTIEKIGAPIKYDSDAAKIEYFDITGVEKGKWVTISQEYEVPIDVDREEVTIGWIGLRMNTTTGGTGTIYIDDITAIPASEYIAEQEYAVSFTVKNDSDQFVENASVLVEGYDELITDATGAASLNSSNINEKAFTVEKDGFSIYEGKFSVIDDVVAVNVMLATYVPPVYYGTIVIKNDMGDPLSGVEVIVGDYNDIYVTDVRGAVVIANLKQGDEVAYTVNVPSYTSISDSFTIGEENGNVVVNLVKQLFAPMANFTQNRVQGESPLTVSFTDQSSYRPTSWEWNFGDGTTSTNQNPFHTYNESGTYSVRLKVTNATGDDTIEKEDLIVAGIPPVAAFSADVTKGTSVLTVQFMDESENTPTAWAWNFGDDNTSTEQNPTHVYQDAGVYTVTLAVTNADGTSELVMEDYITVTEVPIPTAGFTFAIADLNTPKVIQFTDTSTDGPTTWAWDFGDGNSSTEQNPIYTYAEAGTYTVELTSGNDLGETKATLPVVVTSSTLAYESVYENDFTEFSVSETLLNDDRDNDRKFHYIAFQQVDLVRTLTATEEGGNTYLKYEDSNTNASANGQIRTNTVIAFEAGNRYELTFKSRGVGIHFPLIMDTETNTPRERGDQYKDGNNTDWHTHTLTFDVTEAYTATIAIARNWYGTLDIDDISLSIVTEVEEETPSAAVADFTASATAVKVGVEVSFTDTSLEEPTAWAWEFGDGTTSTVQNPKHAYTTKGNYTVKLTATNATGGSSKTMSLTVTENEVETEVAPVADFVVSTSAIKVGESVVFTDASTGNIDAYTWDFGDGNSSTEANPSNTYSEAGTYSVTLTVSNSAGSSEEEKTNLITVTEETPTSVAPDKLAIAIYPNPATDVVNVVAINVTKIAVYNTSGQLVKVVDKQSTTAKVSVSNLNKGLYIFMLTTKGGKSVTRKVQVK